MKPASGQRDRKKPLKMWPFLCISLYINPTLTYD
jgi:hypothetical protein